MQKLTIQNKQLHPLPFDQNTVHFVMLGSSPLGTVLSLLVDPKLVLLGFGSQNTQNLVIIFMIITMWLNFTRAQRYPLWKLWSHFLCRWVRSKILRERWAPKEMVKGFLLPLIFCSDNQTFPHFPTHGGSFSFHKSLFLCCWLGTIVESIRIFTSGQEQL